VPVTIQPAKQLRGELRLPGDKSIAHRALLFGALAEGLHRIEGLPPSEDVASTARCLRQLGVQIDELPDGSVQIPERNWTDGQALDAGNSGTTARLMAGLLAGQGLTATIDGDESLRRRPMGRIATPLEQMGAKITTDDGKLPMKIEGGPIRGIHYELPVASAQVKSAILLAALSAEGETVVVEKAPTRDHTETMFAAMGVNLVREGLAIRLAGGQRLQGTQVIIPGDVSSAAFFVVATLLVPGSEVTLRRVGLNPTRSGLLEVVERMGGRIERQEEATLAGEPMADLVIRNGPLRGVEIGGTLIPAMIDELPVTAALATQAEGRTVVSGAEELRYKESDRIAATVEGLTRMGAKIEARQDGFVIDGPCPLKGATVASHGDHRIAMAMAVAGLIADGPTTIEGSEAVNISFPSFFGDLAALTVE